MLVVVWEFRIKPGMEQGFVQNYGPQGSWAKLMSRSGGYRGTALLRDSADASRFLLTDRWKSEGEFQQFKQHFAEEYAALDKECEALTVSEVCLGNFHEME